MGYSKHSLPRLGRCCVPLRGIATRRPFPRLASSGQLAPPPVCVYSRLAFASTPTQYPQPIRTTAHGGAALCALCAALCAVFWACLVWIFPDQSGGCAGAVRRHGGREKAKEKPPTAGRLWPYLFIFKSSARTTNGKAMIAAKFKKRDFFRACPRDFRYFFLYLLCVPTDTVNRIPANIFRGFRGFLFIMYTPDSNW